MFKIKLYALLVFASVIIVSCTEIDDNFKQYVENGEIEYSNKVDSIKTFNGWNRTKIKASLFNAVTVKEVVVSWNGGDDMLSFPYVKSEDDIDALEFIIPDLEEKSHQFSVYSVDNQGNASIKADAFANVYGETYRSNLLAKSFKSTKSKNDNLSIELSINATLERNSEFKYFSSITGEEIVITTMPEEVNVVLNDVDFSKEVMYRTFYVPDAEAIDEFNSDWVAYAKPQNIVDLLSSAVLMPSVGGVNISIPNPSNLTLDVEFNYMVGGVEKTATINSSDNPVTLEVTGLENGQQDVYLGLSDASQNKVVEVYSVKPIGLVDLDRTGWVVIPSYTSEAPGYNGFRIHLIDNDKTSVWRGLWNAVYPYTIVIDMQEVKTIDVIKIMGEAKSHTSHTWSISDDETNWTEIGTFDMASNKSQQVNTLDATATGRYLKYYTNSPGTDAKFDYLFDIQPAAFE